MIKLKLIILLLYIKFNNSIYTINIILKKIKKFIFNIYSKLFQFLVFFALIHSTDDK